MSFYCFNIPHCADSVSRWRQKSLNLMPFTLCYNDYSPSRQIKVSHFNHTQRTLNYHKEYWMFLSFTIEIEISNAAAENDSISFIIRNACCSTFRLYHRFWNIGANFFYQSLKLSRQFSRVYQSLHRQKSCEFTF